MRVAEEEMPEMPGQDAFLDVLTNMVGIIILLVVVIGIRTSRATIKAAVEQAHVEVPEIDLAAQAQAEKARFALIAAQSDFKGVFQQAVNVRAETAVRAKERDYLTTYVAAFEQELHDRRAALSTENQVDFDLRRKLAESQQQLDNLNREQIALLTQPAEVEAIQNQPTPLARRLTGRMIRLHVSAGHIAVLPEELYEEMMADIKINVWRLRDETSFTGRVGPVGGFKMRYKVGMIPVNSTGEIDPNIPGSSKLAVMVRPELLSYNITLENSTVGEPVAQALAPNSQLRQTLGEHPPDTCTAVIFVYPDSIPELHQVKQELNALGYAAAEIPLPPGETIHYRIGTGRASEFFAQ